MVKNPFERTLVSRGPISSVLEEEALTLALYFEESPLLSGNSFYDQYWNSTLGEPFVAKANLSSSKSRWTKRTLELQFRYQIFEHSRQELYPESRGQELSGRYMEGSIRFSYTEKTFGRKPRSKSASVPVEYELPDKESEEESDEQTFMAKAAIIYIIREMIGDEEWAAKLSRIWAPPRNIENRSPRPQEVSGSPRALLE